MVFLPALKLSSEISMKRGSNVQTPDWWTSALLVSVGHHPSCWSGGQTHDPESRVRIQLASCIWVISHIS